MGRQLKTKTKTRLNSARKGGAWERSCSTTLSIWISSSDPSKPVRDDLVWRSAGSGSRATNGKKIGKSRTSQAGDLTATDIQASLFFSKFFVECKAYRSLHLEGLFWDVTDKTLTTCVDVPIVQSKENKKWPFFLWRQNKRFPLLCLSSKFVSILSDFKVYPRVRFVRVINHENHSFMTEMAVYAWSEIVERVNCSQFLAKIPDRV